jgi:hypothetical protein
MGTVTSFYSTDAHLWPPKTLELPLPTAATLPSSILAATHPNGEENMGEELKRKG